MPNPIDLPFALGLPPEEAIAYFRAKGYTISWDWRDVWREAHARAFTVAKVTRMDILQDIREMVDKALADGIPFEQFLQELEPRLKARGWWGYIFQKNPKTGEMERVLAGSPWRLQTIFRTNIQSAYMAGRYKELLENAGNRPFWQYVAVLDSRTRPKHRALHGKVFRADDPIWLKIYPPNGFNCRCRVRALSEKQLRAKGLKVETGTQDLESFPDPGFDFNPGVEAWKPDLSKYAGDLQKAFLQFPPGLLNQIPVEKWKDIETLMSAFAEQYPGYFARGFVRIERRALGQRVLMQTDYHGIIQVSTRPVSGGLAPSEDLLSALRKIPKMEQLTFDEEYAIETLWHEILHNTALHPSGMRRGSLPDSVMETINQFVARYTYKDFMEILGGVARHQESVIREGRGYKIFLTNFHTLLRTLNMAPHEILNDIRSIHLNTPWDKQWSDLIDFLKEHSPLRSRYGKLDFENRLFNAIDHMVSKHPDDYEKFTSALFL